MMSVEIGYERKFSVLHEIAESHPQAPCVREIGNRPCSTHARSRRPDMFSVRGAFRTSNLLGIVCNRGYDSQFWLQTCRRW